MPTNVTITVPPEPPSARILRAVIGAQAAALPFTYDEIDDLRLALDEAFTLLVFLCGEEDRIIVEITESDGSLVVTAICDADIETWPPDGARRELTWQVLSTLADDASFERLPEGPGIVFRKRPATH